VYYSGIAKYPQNYDQKMHGLYEYGSTDNTLEAARWERGWQGAKDFGWSAALL